LQVFSPETRCVQYKWFDSGGPENEGKDTNAHTRVSMRFPLPGAWFGSPETWCARDFALVTHRLFDRSPTPAGLPCPAWYFTGNTVSVSVATFSAEPDEAGDGELAGGRPSVVPVLTARGIPAL